MLFNSMLFFFIYFMVIWIKSMLILIVPLQWSLLLWRLLSINHHSRWYFLLVLRIISIVTVESFVRYVRGPPLVIRLVHWNSAYMLIWEITAMLLRLQFGVAGHPFRYPCGLGSISCRWLNHLIHHVDVGRRTKNPLRMPPWVWVSASITTQTIFCINFGRFVLQLILRNIWWLIVLKNVWLLYSFYSCRLCRYCLCLWKLLDFTIWSEIISWLCW